MEIVSTREIYSCFAECGFKKSSNEAILYTRCRDGGGILVVSIYVDDIVYTGNDQEMMQTFIADMMQRYEMFDLGLLHHFLGMKIIQTKSSIFIHQRKYAASLLNKFRLQNCKVVSIPLVRSDKLRNDDDSGATDETQYRKIVGSLLYLTVTER